MAFAGTDAGGFIKFIVDSFGSTTDFTKAEAAATLSLPMAPSDDETAEEEEETLQSPGSPDTPALADFCSVKEAKPVYPVSSTLLSAMGVPPEFISENIPSGPQWQSTYHCLFWECINGSTQKATLATHIHRKHLGVTVACKFCSRQWWSSHPFKGHMEKSHPEMTKPDWCTLPDSSQDEKQEAAAAEEALKTCQVLTSDQTPAATEASKQMEVQAAPDSQTG